MSITEPFEPRVVDSNTLYSLDALKARYSTIIEVTPEAYLAVKEDGNWVDFALFDWAGSDGDGKNISVQLIFEGGGPSGNLREARHIYWGPDGKGYTFYLNADAVIAALTYLKKYFDFT